MNADGGGGDVGCHTVVLKAKARHCRVVDCCSTELETVLLYVPRAGR